MSNNAKLNYSKPLNTFKTTKSARRPTANHGDGFVI